MNASLLGSHVLQVNVYSTTVNLRPGGINSIEELTYYPNHINNANRVLLNYTQDPSSSPIFDTVIIKDENGTVQNSFIVYAHVPMIIKKDRLHTLEIGTAANGLFATSVGIEG